MKATIELNLETMVYYVTLTMDGGTQKGARGPIELGRVAPTRVDKIAAGFKDASWVLTTAVLSELRKP